MVNLKSKRGFTLIEILVVIAIITILSAAVIIAVNPGRQFAQARDTQRWTAVNAILNAVHQNMVDNKGVFKCGSLTIPGTSTDIAPTPGFDICACLVPVYIASMPADPSTGNYTDCTTYDSKFFISSSTSSRITVSAPSAENQAISVTR